MSSFILCHERKANKPFYLEDINLNIYTIEELCFYLCNNLYLLNHRILNKELCSWIDEELGMSHLAGLLIQTLPSQSLVRFVVTILSHVGFCEEGELEDIQHTLLSLKDQSEEEQRKRKADNLLNNGKYESALIEYERILRKKTSDRLGREFMERFTIIRVWPLQNSLCIRRRRRSLAVHMSLVEKKSPCRSFCLQNTLHFRMKNLRSFFRRTKNSDRQRNRCKMNTANRKDSTVSLWDKNSTVIKI